MTFGGKVQDGLWLGREKDRLHGFRVANVCSDKTIVSTFLNCRKRRQIGGVRQLIDVRHLPIAIPHKVPYQRGTYEAGAPVTITLIGCTPPAGPRSQR